jgi:penicillin amidase
MDRMEWRKTATWRSPLLRAGNRRLCGAILAALVLAPGVRGQDGAVTLTVDGDSVTIRRDGYGVPHVSAGTERGLYYGNGYAVAQDRLAQMEKYRRTAKGEMAELVGPRALDADRETRANGYTQAEREAQLAALDSRLQAMLRSYADGVNAFLQQGEKDGLPGEVQKLGVKVAPWQPADSLAIGQMMARRFGGGGGGELRNLQILSLLKLTFGDQAPKVFDDLVWLNDPAAPATVPAEESSADPLRAGMGARRVGGAARLTPPPPGQFALTPARPEEVEPGRAVADLEAELAFARANGLPTRWGSYAIAVAPAKRAARSAALVGGPQMGFATPQIAHEVHLAGAGCNVIGMGFAGVPGVLIGHNERVAWSTTTGVGDLEDIFVETLDPADPHRYRFKGEWRPMERRVETIAVRGQAPVTQEVFRTVHGPVVQLDAAKQVAYARAASYWNREGGATDAIYRFNRAANLREFAAAVPLIATSHNWLCATVDGDIGYWFGGRFPVRAAGVDPRLPTPGDGEHEWQGFRPFATLPQSVNPRQGFLANWNNKPAVWWNSGDTPAWGSIHRVQRIFDLVRGRDDQTADDLKAVLRDISDNDERAAALKPLLLEAVAAAPPAGAPARILGAWDDHSTDGSIGKQLFDTYVRELRVAIFGGKIGFVPENLREQALSPGVLLRILQGKGAPLPVSTDYLQGKTAAEVMRLAWGQSLAALTKERGPNVADWGWRRGRIRFEPLPPIPEQNRGTYVQIVELEPAGVRAVSILPPGQSEDPASPHYGDQRELAGYWLFKPMILRREGP